MITTVHLDRHGYVLEVFCDTRAAQLDEGKFHGKLMEVTGPVVPGMRWNGEAFVSPPPRIPPEAVLAERARRSAMVPDGFVKQITKLGGDNAMKVSKYLGEIHNAAERMMLSEPPADFKDDKHWPTVPELHDLPVAQRVHEFQSVPSVSGVPANITVAPVINVTAPEGKPVIVEHPTLPQGTVESQMIGGFALDPNDPLYLHKLALIRAIDEYDKKYKIPDAVEPEVTKVAIKATAATNLEEIEAHKSRVQRLLEAA
jgi:hypothetical protein